MQPQPQEQKANNMKKFRELSSQIKEKDEREYDYEGAMAKTQLKTIIRNAENIHDMLDDDENLPEWIQSKITLAKDYIVLASNYLESEMDESSSAYDRINKRFKDLSGRSLGDAAKEHGAEAKRLQKEIDAQKAENERRKAAMKTEEIELDEIAVVKTNKPIGTRVADIGPGGKEYNVKTNKAYDDAKKKKPQEAFFATQRRKERLASSGRMDEDIESLDEKNEPTNPALWSRAKSLAKSKFDVYPSAYANGWASKWYKSKGGGWRTVSEETSAASSLDKPKQNKSVALAGKHSLGYSTARHLARMAMQKQIEKLKKPVKEAEEKAMETFLIPSKRAQIVKDAVNSKKNKNSNKFESEPILSDTVTRNS